MLNTIKYITQLLEKLPKKNLFNEIFAIFSLKPNILLLKSLHIPDLRFVKITL